MPALQSGRRDSGMGDGLSSMLNNTGAAGNRGLYRRHVLCVTLRYVEVCVPNSRGAASTATTKAADKHKHKHRRKDGGDQGLSNGIAGTALPSPTKASAGKPAAGHTRKTSAASIVKPGKLLAMGSKRISDSELTSP